MAELRIETAPRALELLQKGWPTRAVSLVGDDLRFDLPKFGEHHLILRFHDVENEDIDEFVAPTSEGLATVIAHTRKLQAGDRILIHCHAGKSRSPAMAIGILIANGASPQVALDRVKALRPIVIPNRLMISLLDELLSLDGELIGVVGKHYASLPSDASLPDRGGRNR